MKKYGFLRLSEDKKYWIIEKAEPHVSIRLKQVFPKIQKTAVPPYFITRSIYIDADIDWFMQRYPLEMSDHDQAALRTMEATRP